MYKLNISRTCNGKPVWISKHYAIHLFVNGATRVWAMGPLKAGHCDLNAFYYVFAEGQCAQSPTCSGPGAKPRNGGWMSYNRKTKHWARGMGVTVTPVDLSNHMGIDRIIVDSGDANAFGVTEAVLNAVGTAMREWLHSSSAHPAVPAHAPVPSYTLSGDPIHAHNGEYILLPDAECSGLPVYKHTTSALVGYYNPTSPFISFSDTSTSQLLPYFSLPTTVISDSSKLLDNRFFCIT